MTNIRCVEHPDDCLHKSARRRVPGFRSGPGRVRMRRGRDEEYLKKCISGHELGLSRGATPPKREEQYILSRFLLFCFSSQSYQGRESKETEMAVKKITPETMT